MPDPNFFDTHCGLHVISASHELGRNNGAFLRKCREYIRDGVIKPCTHEICSQ